MTCNKHIGHFCKTHKITLTTYWIFEKFTFIECAPVASLIVIFHIYLTKEDAKHPDFKINLVGDISCDIDGPVASTLRASTIADPFYSYDPMSEKEAHFKIKNTITVMAVDNLPCELPKDASEGFGTMFLSQVIPAFFNGDKDGVLQRAKITTAEGTLTERFSYLQDYVDGHPK